MAKVTKVYDEAAVVQAVKDILKIALFSRGVDIHISLAIDKAPTITYTIKDAPILETEN